MTEDQRVSGDEPSLRALTEAEIEAAAPFFRLADEIINAVPSDASYRDWITDSQDWTVIFGFAGHNITLGELRKAAAVVSARKDGSSPQNGTAP